MTELTLTFTPLPRAELIATRFAHPKLANEVVARLGAYERSFKWTAGVQALSTLLLRTVAWYGCGQASLPGPCLEGRRPSLAASLNDVVTKTPQWVCDMFGKVGGRSLVSTLIGRWNPDFNTSPKAPVQLWLEASELPPDRIRVNIDGRLVNDPEELRALADDVIQQWIGTRGRPESVRPEVVALSPRNCDADPLEVRLSVGTGTVLIEVRLIRDFDSFGPKEEEEVMRAIRALLKTTRELPVRDKRRGSVILTLELTADEARELTAAIAEGALAEFGATSAKVVVALRTRDGEAGMPLPGLVTGASQEGTSVPTPVAPTARQSEGLNYHDTLRRLGLRALLAGVLIMVLATTVLYKRDQHEIAQQAVVESGTVRQSEKRSNYSANTPVPIWWCPDSAHFRAVGPENRIWAVALRDRSLVELTPDPRSDRYRVSLELRQWNTSVHAGGYGGVYFGYSSTITAGGVQTHTAFSLRFVQPTKDSPDYPGGTIEFGTVHVVDRQGQPLILDYAPMRGRQVPRAKDLPQWSDIELVITPERIVAVWNDVPISIEGKEAREHYREGQVEANRTEPPILVSDWNPRSPLGVMRDGCEVEVRNVRIVPLLEK